MQGGVAFVAMKADTVRGCAVQGGIAFVAIKGVLKLYYKQQQYIRQAQRRILNFDDATTSTQTPPAAD